MTENTNLGVALGVWTEDEAVALVCVDHVGELGREDVVAAILALLLSGDRVHVLDGQVLVERLRIELAFRRLAPLEVNDSGDFDAIPRIIICLLGLGRGLPALRMTSLGMLLRMRIFLSALVDQDIDIGEELHLAVAAQVGRGRSQTSIVNGRHASLHGHLKVVSVHRCIQFAVR